MWILTMWILKSVNLEKSVNFETVWILKMVAKWYFLFDFQTLKESLRINKDWQQGPNTRKYLYLLFLFLYFLMKIFALPSVQFF